MKLSSSIQSNIAEATSVLQNVLAESLVKRRKKAAKHDKMMANKKEQAKHYAKLYEALVQKAVRGAKKLVKVYRSVEVTELLMLIEKTHGRDHQLELYAAHVDFVVEYLMWQWTACDISISRKGVLLHVLQVSPTRDVHKQEKESFLDNPLKLNETREYEERVSIELEIQEFLELEALDAEFIVESVKGINLFEEAEGEKAKVAWLAFLSACDDEKNIARFLRDALKKLSLKKKQP